MSKRSALSQFYLVLVVLSAFCGSSYGRRNRPSGGRYTDYDDAVVGGGGGYNGMGQREESQAALMASRASRVAKGSEMLGYMNTTADPCKDFYEYACGKWISVFRRKLTEEAARDGGQTRNETSIVDELRLKVIGNLQSLLQTAPMRNDSKDVMKVKQFFRSCTTAERGSTSQKAFMLEFAKNMGGLPGVPRTRWNINQADWINKIGTLRYRYGMDILMGLEYGRDLYRHNMHSYYITEPKDTLIPAPLCNMEAIRRGALLRDESYEAIKREVAENMKNWFGMADNRASAFASEVVRFEFELCKGMRSTRLEDGRLQSRRLQQLTEKFQPDIDFKQFVDTSLNTSLNDEVYLRHESYFQHLRTQLRQSSRPTMTNYIMYRALVKFHLPNDVATKAWAPYCVELASKYFPHIVGDMYNQQYKQQEAIMSMNQIFTKVLGTFRDALRSEWLKDTKESQQKVLRSKLNFCDYDNREPNALHLDSSADFWRTLDAVIQYYTEEVRSNTDDDPQNAVKSPDVHMQYVADKTMVISGLGLLQPPFYHHSYGQSLRYSVIGHWMAKALSSAFLAQGWANNGGGAGHWSQDFHNRSECFRQQYSNYLYNNPDEFRNQSKVAEIMADSSGLNIAFGAYIKWLTDMRSDQGDLLKETLPGVNYSNTQLFFIHFAQSRCTAKRDEEWPPVFLPLSRHTPERYNVNGHLANNEEFAREFGCPAGSEMNPADKCAIY